MMTYLFIFCYCFLTGFVPTHSSSIPSPDTVSCTDTVHPTKPFSNSTVSFYTAGQAAQAHRPRNEGGAFTELHPSVTGWTGPIISSFVSVTVQFTTAAQPIATGGEPALKWKTGNHGNLCWYSGGDCSGERSKCWHADQDGQRASMCLISFSSSFQSSLALALTLH